MADDDPFWVDLEARQRRCRESEKIAAMGPEGQIEFMFSVYVALPPTDPRRQRIIAALRKVREQAEHGATPDERAAEKQEFLDLLVDLRKFVQ